MDMSLIFVLLYVIGCSYGQFNIPHYPLPTEPMGYGFVGGIYNNTFTFLDLTSRPNGLAYSAPINPYEGEWSNPIPITYPSGITSFNWLYSHNNVQVDNLIYIINPISYPTYARHQLLIYNLETNELTVSTKPIKPATKGCAQYDLLRDLIYYVGDGAYPESNGTFQVYDIGDLSWSMKTPSPINAANSGCAMEGESEYFYQFGGSGYRGGGTRVYDTINRYDVTNNSWTQLNQRLSSPKFLLVCKLYTDGLIYCFGGIIKWSWSESMVEVFDPNTNTIINTMNMKYTRAAHRVDLYQNCMIISGGRGLLAWSTQMRQREIYDIEYFGDCTQFLVPCPFKDTSPDLCPSPDFHQCDCDETVLISEESINGIERCYTYQHTSRPIFGCNPDSLDWIAFGRGKTKCGLGWTDWASKPTSYSPNTLKFKARFDGGKVVGLQNSLKISRLDNIENFTICFDESRVSGTATDAKIGYKRGIEKYSCWTSNVLPDFCNADTSSVGLFEFDADNDHDERPLMINYIWSGLIAAFVSITVVLIAYICFIKPRTKSQVYHSKMILDDE